jgi:proteasome lid subunit RPN8/RPN11
MLRITKTVLDAIISHSEKELPNESCGYLAKKDDLIRYHYELTNKDNAIDHYTMDPKDQFTAIRDMRKRALKLAAVYHSHPQTPARPSAEDIRLAYDPDMSYVIISLAGEAQSVKSFRIASGVVSEESIEIIDEQ